MPLACAKAHLGLVVEKSSHGDTLLITATQSIPPFPRNTPAALTIDNVTHLDDVEEAHQVGVADTFSLHLLV
jgi:hypothetical protein